MPGAQLEATGAQLEAAGAQLEATLESSYPQQADHYWYWGCWYGVGP